MNVFVAPTAPSTLSYRGNPGSFIMLCCTPFTLLLLMPVRRGVLIYFKNWVSKSMGSGKMMVEFFSAEMVDKVCAKREKKSNDYTLRLGKRLQESTRPTFVTRETRSLEGILMMWCDVLPEGTVTAERPAIGWWPSLPLWEQSRSCILPRRRWL